MGMKDNGTEFSHLPSKEDLLRAYQRGSQTDPASIHYKRILIRPTLNVRRVILLVSVTMLVASAVALAYYLIWENIGGAILLLAAIPTLTMLIFAKRVTIWLIMAYQRFAPARIRERCRYEPSCSQYAITALKKYGYFKGMYKAIKRLISCRPPNGGIDFP